MVCEEIQAASVSAPRNSQIGVTEDHKGHEGHQSVCSVVTFVSCLFLISSSPPEEGLLRSAFCSLSAFAFLVSLLLEIVFLVTVSELFQSSFLALVSLLLPVSDFILS